ncbi:MAG: nucleotidyltransferase domain-containing protein [Nanoarchaeota archaeon]|nr:nucleotidyltransferase domain-containing protein [Nanoarchaeota archaeon]
MNKKLEKMKPLLIKTLKANGVMRAGIFGSYARGDSKKGSDIDLLVYINKKISLLGLASLKVDIEDKLKKRVDLVEYKMIHPSLKRKILDEEIRII